jgi:hypothetical protein
MVVAVIAMAATKNKEINIVDLPENITGLKAETKAHPRLQQLIINYYDIQKEDYKKTRYFYNFVDLNSDGNKEIFVVIMNPFTSGTNRNKALWVFENDGELEVRQEFTLVSTPIIISNNITKGVRDLIFSYHDEGTNPKYSVLACNGGHFPLISNGKMLDSLDGVVGEAIIANDIIAETAAGNLGLTLDAN